MINFDFISPTRIIFGKEKEKEIGKIISSYGFSSVLLVYGGESVKRIGAYDSVANSLKENGITFKELKGVRPNPEVSSVIEGVRIAKEIRAELILALGGGSPIDCAKAIAAYYYHDGDFMDYSLGKANLTKALPVGVILTVSGAGSEASNSCVISSDSLNIKKGFHSDLVRPLFAIENPELTYSVSLRQTAIGAVDAIMHSLERYLCPSSNDELADSFALDICRNLKDSLLVCMKNPHDYDVRANLMVGSTLSHNGLTGIGKQTRFAIHPLQAAIGGLHPEHVHGEGVGILYIGYCKVMMDQLEDKLASIAKILFNIDYIDKRKAAIMGVEAWKDFLKSLSLAASLSEIGIVESDLQSFADLVTGNGTRVVGCCRRPLDREMALEAYRACLR